MATVANIISRAVSACGGGELGGDLDAALKLALYNQAQHLLNRSANLRDARVLDVTTMATVVSTYAVTLPTDCKSIIALRLIDGTSSRRMIRRTPTWMDAQFAKPDATSTTGKPWFYCRREPTKIEHNPVADDAYEIWADYYKWFSDHTVNTDATNYSNADDVLAEGTKYYIWNHLGELDKAAASLMTFNGLLGSVLRAEQDKIDLEFEVEAYSPGVSEPLDSYIDPRWPPG